MLDLFYLVFIAVPAIPSPFWKTALSFFFWKHTAVGTFFLAMRRYLKKDEARRFHGFFMVFSAAFVR